MEEAPASAIALERVGPGPTSWAFRVALVALAAAAAGALFLLADRAGTATPAETAAAADGPWAEMVGGMTTASARWIAVAGGALAVASTALLGRRLLHSGAAGLFAALLVALDPAFLVWGSHALPHAPLAGLLLAAGAALAAPRPAWHWTGSLLLGAAAFLDPWTLLWAVPLALLVLVRGHIYASGRHLGVSLVQTTLVPALAAGVSLGAAGLSSGCLRGAWHEELLLLKVQGVGAMQPALHNPALHYAGLATLLVMAVAAVLHMASHFRLARMPGRVQIRLPEPLPPLRARSLWILALVLLAPHPAVLWPLLALGLAAGIWELGEDAPGFGLALAGVALAFAALFLVRAWPVVAGTASPDEVSELLDFTPWATLAGC